MSIEATAGALAGSSRKASNTQIIRRLLTYMTPFNAIMITSLVGRVVKIVRKSETAQEFVAYRLVTKG